MSPEHQTKLDRDYGRNPWPCFFDRKSQSADGRRLFALIARSEDPQDGFSEINYSRVANAINRASWWLVQGSPSALRDKEPFAYMGPNDLRYLIFAVAGMKSGRPMLHPSIRNTIEAQKMLFERLDCHLLVYGDKLEKSLQPLFSAMPEVTTRVAPTLEKLLDDTSVPHFEAMVVDDSRKCDPLIFFHTSGSSGNPKPIGWSSDSILSIFNHNGSPTAAGPSSAMTGLRDQHSLCLLPPFHAGGSAFGLLAPYTDAVLVLPHPNAALAPEYIISLLQQDIITSMISPPSILSDLSQTSAGIEALAKLQHVGYIGGPLPEYAGKILAPKLKHLWSFIGATEYGYFHTIPGGSNKWQCIKFNPDVGYRFDEVSPGLYELVIPNDPATRKYHATPYTFPDLDEYPTRDLYTALEDGWMRYEGRRDDLIVLSNGEKINPVPLEAIISSHPAVEGAVIVGEYRFLPCLLIELKDGSVLEEEREKMLDVIWPTIEKANSEAPRFSRITKSLVYILSSKEAFGRAGKGTIQRQATVKNFAAQVQELYSSAELGLLAEGLDISDPSDPISIRDLVKRLYCHVLDVETLNGNDDVFELGMDSLQVAIAVQKLKASMRAGHVEIDYGKITPQLFYASPSVEKLASSLHGLINGHEHTNGTPDEASIRRARVQKMLDRYLVEPSNGVHNSEKKKMQGYNTTIILTGSTGSLGSYLLAALLSSPKISKVICLNRTSDAEKRQRASHELKGLGGSSWDDQNGISRVEFITTDLSKRKLGLDNKTYTRLLSETGAIIHCAWKVNFNQTLETFESQIAGVHHVIDLAKRATSLVPIMFVSSISSALNLIQKHPDQVVPEAIIHDLDAPDRMGYGESKYIGERLLEASGVPSAVLRVGQVAGPVRSRSGIWNTQEWFPSLVTSSKYLGMLPTSLGSMDNITWIPVDLLASVMMQLLDVLSGGAERAPCTVYNVVNPRLARWSSLLPVVQTQLGGSSEIRAVSMTEWTEALERSMGDNFGYVADENPAVKLLEFYKLLARAGPQSPSEVKSEWEVEHLVRDSPEAASLKAVSPDWIKIWMKQWGP